MSFEVILNFMQHLWLHDISIHTNFHQNNSSTFVYGPILMEICMNANIMKPQFFHKIIYDLKITSYVMERFCDFFTCGQLLSLSNKHLGLLSLFIPFEVHFLLGLIRTNMQ